MVIKGILEEITTNTVNLVNADLLAKTRGLRIIESIVPAEGRSAPLPPYLCKALLMQSRGQPRSAACAGRTHCLYCRA